MNSTPTPFDWSLTVAIASLLVSLIGLFAFFLQRRDYWQTELHEDASLRQEWATRLRGASMGGVYRDTLARALVGLDRLFGPPGSAQALGVCFLVAVAYAWASFFLGWGWLGGSGKIGDFVLLADKVGQPSQAIAAALIVFLPVLSFFLARWLVRCVYRYERRWQAGLLQRWPGRRRSFHWAYCSVLAIVVFGLIFWGVRFSGDSDGWAAVVFFVAMPLLGTQTGRLAGGWFAGNLSTSLAAFIFGALAGGGAMVLAGALVGAVAVALAVAGAGALALAGAGVVALVGALVVAVAVAVVVIQAVVIGASLAIARSTTRGIWAGGIGGLVGMAGGTLSYAHTDDEIVILLLLFFLILPSVNSLFDWLSWWATRALGQRLLAVLQPAQGLWRRAGAIIAHGLVDLAAAVALLLAMAYALGLGFEGYNSLALLKGDKLPFDLPPMIQAAAADPWHTGFWLSAMLLTTLLPTFGHGLMLLFSPLGFSLIPDQTRMRLADDLDNYQVDSTRQPRIRREVALWYTQSRLLGYFVALLLLCWLLLRLSVFISLFHPGGLSDIVANAAYAGMHTADWFSGVHR